MWALPCGMKQHGSLFSSSYLDLLRVLTRSKCGKVVGRAWGVEEGGKSNVGCEAHWMSWHFLAQPALQGYYEVKMGGENVLLCFANTLPDHLSYCSRQVTKKIFPNHKLSKASCQTGGNKMANSAESSPPLINTCNEHAKQISPAFNKSRRKQEGGKKSAIPCCGCCYRGISASPNCCSHFSMKEGLAIRAKLGVACKLLLSNLTTALFREKQFSGGAG